MDTGQTVGYGSARDLPSILEMERQIAGLGLLTFFVGREHRQTVKQLKAQLAELTATVDEFYALLGPRNWIFPDRMNLTTLRGLSRLAAEDAERQLIAAYRDGTFVEEETRRLWRFPEFRVRMPLVERAAEDYRQDRFYAVVLGLLPVMDGFVNDFQPARRRGLHAREPQEMVAWDSVVGHHMGLARAHATFIKGFYKTSTDEVTQLFRNGILHGMLVNFDNVVVATKAWNRLFAVADWADAEVERATPPKKHPSWRQLMVQIGENRAARAALDEWRSSIISNESPGFANDPVVEATRRYLEAWLARNFGAMADLISPLALGGKPQSRPRQVRTEMDVRLDQFEVRGVEYTAPAVAFARAKILTERGSDHASFRWIRCDQTGESVTPNRPGEWRLMNWTYWGLREAPR